MAVNGPYFGNDYIHMFIMDLLLQETPWVDLPLVCPSERNSVKTNKQSNLAKNKISNRSKKDTSALVGTYGNFAYGNLTVFFNDTTEMLNMRYGERVMFEMTETSTDIYQAQGMEPLWQNTYTMTFVVGGEDVDKVTVDFETRMPPTFERDLNQGEAPPPQTLFDKSSAGKLENTATFLSGLLFLLYIA